MLQPRVSGRAFLITREKYFGKPRAVQAALEIVSSAQRLPSDDGARVSTPRPAALSFPAVLRAIKVI